MDASFFLKVPLAQPDAIFGLVSAFKEDTRPEKCSFVVGFYQSEEGTTPVMESVRKAEQRVVERRMGKEYLPIDGDKRFLSSIGELVFGAIWKEAEKRVVAAQTVGGTGALRLMADFAREQISNNLLLSDPTWPNHRSIFARAGFSLIPYSYYDFRLHQVKKEEIFETLQKAPEHALVLLHANCHNPTGMDFTYSEWQELSHIMLKRRLFPFFDMAYQGFGDTLEKDAQPVRLFAEQGHEMALAYSCAKNFSLYGERVGALFILPQTARESESIRSQLRVLIRSNYSNPPLHGARIVTELLSDPSLSASWRQELSSMRKRMQEMRILFSDSLKNRIPSKSWDFIERTRGLFCYTGLDSKAVARLREEYALYMPTDGRINITAITHKNLEQLVEAMAQV